MEDLTFIRTEARSHKSRNMSYMEHACKAGRGVSVCVCLTNGSRMVKISVRAKCPSFYAK